MIKKHETLTDNPPIQMYVNSVEKRITFEMKTIYYFKRSIEKEGN